MKEGGEHGAGARRPGRRTSVYRGCGLLLLVFVWGLLVWRTLWPPLMVEVPGFHPEGMVYCPGGRLQGTGPFAQRVRPFWIDRFEVTQEDYARFLATNPGHPPPVDWKGARTQGDGGLGPRDLPVVWVSLHDARAYAQWRGARLPTVQEWEWAALGSRGLPFPWGALSPDIRANTVEANLGQRTPVGLFPSGASTHAGCYDMVGNVREWTGTPIDAFADQYYVRGGSYEDPLYVRESTGITTVLDTHTQQEEVRRGVVSKASELCSAVLAFDLNRVFETLLDVSSDGVFETLPRFPEPIQDRVETTGSSSGVIGFRCARSVDDHATLELLHDRVARLVGKLGARDPVTWFLSTRSAQQELVDMGEPALPTLRVALTWATGTLVADRVEGVIAAIEAGSAP